MTTASYKGPIAKRVISDLRKQSKRKVVNLDEVRSAKIDADDLQKTVLSSEDLADHDPLHGVYVYAQNMLSVLTEQLGELPALMKLNNAYADAHEIYMPSGPPMSPLTTSYFTCWGLFDLVAGVKKESFGSICIDLCRALHVNRHLIRVFEIMQGSRMGFYVHEGTDQEFVLLREIITNERIKAIVPAGYAGLRGEIWYVRVLPEPFAELGYGYSVVFTTPYVIAQEDSRGLTFASERKWLAYFERNLDKTGKKDQRTAYEHLLKYGLSRHYWNEYVFESYSNHRNEMIMLVGLPDAAITRPHSPEYQRPR
jgi:hypothetical protein